MTAQMHAMLEAAPPGPPLRLLADVPVDGSAPSLVEHRRRYRKPPPPQRGSWPAILDEVGRSGLRGRGGAGFPTALKLSALARHRGPRVVVANGAEGEPASHKDRLLLTGAPHLVLDGALLAAAAIGAEQVVVVVDRAHVAALAAVRRAVAERAKTEWGGADVRVEACPSRYVAGESSAVVRWLNGGQAKPSGVHAHESGVGGAPTLVQNVETLAHLAQVLNYGAGWFRSAGPPDEPGTTLVTVSGGVRRPSVVEVPVGATLGDLAARAGGVTAPPQALLVGGFFGTWVPAGAAFDTPFSRRGLGVLGASPGAGVVIVLPAWACGLSETSRVLRWFAAETAGQCGPCVFGLPALADALEQVVRGAGAPADVARLRRWADEIEGRGACRHPDGASGLLRSALAVFADDLARHAGGSPCAGVGTPVLHVPPVNGGWR